MHAEADVRPVSESDLEPAFSRTTSYGRVREDGRVAVGGGEGEDDEVARRTGAPPSSTSRVA